MPTTLRLPDKQPDHIQFADDPFGVAHHQARRLRRPLTAGDPLASYVKHAFVGQSAPSLASFAYARH